MINRIAPSGRLGVFLALGKHSPVNGGPQYLVSKWQLVWIKMQPFPRHMQPCTGVHRLDLSLPDLAPLCSAHPAQHKGQTCLLPTTQLRQSLLPSILVATDLFISPNRQSTTEGRKSLIYLSTCGDKANKSLRCMSLMTNQQTHVGMIRKAVSVGKL